MAASIALPPDENHHLAAAVAAIARMVQAPHPNILASPPVDAAATATGPASTGPAPALPRGPTLP